MRSCCFLVLALCLALVAPGVPVSPCAAQNIPSFFCLPTSEVGRHPLFPALAQRPDIEVDEQGQSTAARATTVAFGDLTGNGRPDAVLSMGPPDPNTGERTYITVMLNRGGGVFDPPVAYDAFTRAVFAVAVADFDGDGRLDLAGTAISRDDITVQYNRSCHSPCPADLTGSADPADPRYGVPDLAVTIEDFLVYLDLFAARHPRADLNSDGELDAADFFFYLDLYAQGCPD